MAWVGHPGETELVSSEVSLKGREIQLARLKLRGSWTAIFLYQDSPVPEPCCGISPHLAWRADQEGGTRLRQQSGKSREKMCQGSRVILLLMIFYPMKR